MNGIEKQAAFYRGYLIDDRSLAPLTIAFAAIAGLWLLVYLISAIGGPGGEPADAAGCGAHVAASLRELGVDRTSSFISVNYDLFLM
jgi:hypothetical protein